jgi:hypothetical protein
VWRFWGVVLITQQLAARWGAREPTRFFRGKELLQIQLAGELG